MDENNSILDRINNLTASYIRGVNSTVENGVNINNNLISTAPNFVEIIPAFEIGNTFSIEIYIKFNILDNRQQRILVFDNGSWNGYPIMLTTTGSNNNIRFFGNNNVVTDYKLINGGNLTLDWEHIVVTINGSNWKLYQNSVLIDSTNDGIILESRKRINHLLGTDNGSSNNLDGSIKLLRIWNNISLSNDEVIKIYNVRDNSSLYDEEPEPEPEPEPDIPLHYTLGRKSNTDFMSTKQKNANIIRQQKYTLSNVSVKNNNSSLFVGSKNKF